MNAFEKSLLEGIGEDSFRKVSSARIGIAGSGGLGSNCAVNLVRCGFRSFRIIDLDRVEHSNLNRQFFFIDQVGMEKVKALEANLRRINPDIELEAVTGQLKPGHARRFFSGCDIVVEALDNAEAKSMLVGELLPSGKFIVSVSGIGGYGSSDDIRIMKIKENLVMIGDQVSDTDSRPPFSPRVNIAAAKQADVILKHVIG
ncbi:MAG: sulfur carrier protein ThiS adenylyltransferase ThiF [Candidatus Omnitrophica bacterium]|nr:sulfur carrier protein ThiS adenylyltransferase ThiF [Candidatus Omnitrophota bacterium]